MYILTFIQKTGSKSKSSVLRDCSELDSEIILSECRIVGALEGTRLELGVRLVTLQLYTYWYNTAVQNFKNYRCWSGIMWDKRHLRNYMRVGVGGA